MADLLDGAGKPDGRFLQHTPSFGSDTVGSAERHGHGAVRFGNRKRRVGHIVESRRMAPGHCRHVLNRTGDIDQIDAEGGGFLRKLRKNSLQRLTIRGLRFAGGILLDVQRILEKLHATWLKSCNQSAGISLRL
jgi:hypothetical protein